MENTEINLFDLQMDEMSKSYLKETAKWAKFLSIVGIVICILMVLAGIWVAFAFGSAGRELGGMFAATGGSFIGIFYLFIAALYFFPCLYLFRFSKNMLESLNTGENFQMQDAFRNLKSSFKFVGILTIIVLSLYILAIVGAGIFAAFTL